MERTYDKLVRDNIPGHHKGSGQLSDAEMNITERDGDIFRIMQENCIHYEVLKA